MRRKTKIVATVGPSCSSPQMLQKLVRAGVDVFRLNFSHGTHQSHKAVVNHIRAVSRQLESPVAIMQDLQGPKIRTGATEGGRPIELKAGRRLIITTRKVVGNASIVSTNYKRLPHDVRPGKRILLSDGLIELRVRKSGAHEVVCDVINGGLLGEHKGINLPGIKVTAPSLTRKDKEDILFAVRERLDFIALSFVRSARNIHDLRRLLQKHDTDIPVVAKLEKPQSIENLDEILNASDVVMVARGDLGVEIYPEKVPGIQKRIILEASRTGKLVITATQMLESMVNNPRPTRAEASDVANAIFDGTDAVMLSAETATGNYPIKAVEMMARIIQEAEKTPALSHFFHAQSPIRRTTFPDAICEAAYHASHFINAKYIVAFTQSGVTANLIAKYRPASHILTFTPHEPVVRRLMLTWGVTPIRMREISNVDELILALESELVTRRLAKKGDRLAILTGAPLIEKGHTSLLKLHQIGGDNIR
ncbi:MAG TPA: pyruvate kinase [Acidobacteriota bacterium]|jgi:pyruvate kinase